MLSAILDQVFRRESGRVLAGLIRHFGDFDLAEDALQDACTKALTAWPRDGIPENPAAWLTTVARRRSVDLTRRKKKHTALPELAGETVDDDIGPAAATGVEDDRLRLLFTCCHPAINREAQVGLALRTLGGLTTREIARAFVEPEATTAQRLVRAKAKIREANIPYQLPTPADLPVRLQSVLEIVYLIFNEGYAATESESFVRVDLCAEAIRLGRVIVELLPDEAEVLGLLALMLLTDARRPARLNAAGELVPLEEQDRSLWHREQIIEGTQVLERALPMRKSGSYQIQAAIASLHCNAPTSEATDWPQIAALYGGLLRRGATPVIELNAAVAVFFAGDQDQGLQWIDEIANRGVLDDYHLLFSSRAELLRRAGRTADAKRDYQRALKLVKTPAERQYLERRLSELPGP